MNVAVRPSNLNLISLCTGGGGLDLGVQLAMPSARSVCYVEREAFGCAHLVAAMQQGLLDEAPLWSDVTTFHGRPWRGIVDGLVGGIPCQPHSLAGKRLGEDDERDLWSDARRIVVQSGCWFVLIENVRGIVSSGGAERVWRDLSRLGFILEAGLFTAAEVGASHERERWFGLAVADSRCLRDERRGGTGDVLCAPNETQSARYQRQRDGNAPDDSGDCLADAEGEYCGRKFEQSGTRSRRSRSERSDGELAYANSAGLALGQRPTIKRGTVRNEGQAITARCDGMGNTIGSRHDGRQDDALGRSVGRTAAEGASCEFDGSMGHAMRAGLHASAHGGIHRIEKGRRPRDENPDGPSQPMADTNLALVQRQPSTWQQPLLQSDDGIGGAYLFPPGPSDLANWRAVLKTAPQLEPAFRRMADGLASGMDVARQSTDRTDRLRMLGNGVVSLEAVYALRTLAARLAASGSSAAKRLVRAMELTT